MDKVSHEWPWVYGMGTERGWGRSEKQGDNLTQSLHLQIIQSRGFWFSNGDPRLFGMKVVLLYRAIIPGRGWQSLCSSWVSIPSQCFLLNNKLRWPTLGIGIWEGRLRSSFLKRRWMKSMETQCHPGSDREWDSAKHLHTLWTNLFPLWSHLAVDIPCV